MGLCVTWKHWPKIKLRHNFLSKESTCANISIFVKSLTLNSIGAISKIGESPFFGETLIMALYDSLRPFTILLKVPPYRLYCTILRVVVILSMVVSNVWGRGGESTKRTLFDPMRSSGQTIWKFQQEVSFFSLARCFIGEKYELRWWYVSRDVLCRRRPQRRARLEWSSSRPSPWTRPFPIHIFS